MDCSDGYVSGIDYTYGYYRHLSPLYQAHILWHLRLETPRSPNPTYLELGCGQGVSFCVHAAAQPGEYWGVDFNPAHVMHARELDTAAGSNSIIEAESFAVFADRAESGEVPMFDYISLHGIWSWISAENRGHLLRIIRACLKPGGVVCISYNTAPGYGPFAPTSRLMYLFGEHSMSTDIPAHERIVSSMEFISGLVEASAQHYQSNALAKRIFEEQKGKNPVYLAHEFFTREWHTPMFFEVNQDLKDIGLVFCSTASMLDQVDALHVSEQGQRFLAKIPDVAFRETVRDFFINRRFRTDLYVRGKRGIPEHPWLQMLKRRKFVLALSPEDVPMKITGNHQEVLLSERVYRPLIEEFARRDRPATIDSVYERIRESQVGFNDIMQAVFVLSGQGHLLPTQPEEVVEEAAKRTSRLNRFLCEKAEYSDDITILACPVSGTAIPLRKILKLFLLAREDGIKGNEGMARHVWDILDRQGKKITKDGKVLQTPEENIEDLVSQHKTFEEKVLPILKRLGVAN